MKLNDTLEQAQGQLEKLDDAQFDQLDFEWEGIRFHAKSEENHSNGAHIHIQANLGRLFLTVEDPNQRAMAIERLYSTNRGIDSSYSIGDQGKITFESITTTDEKLLGSELMSALTLILLESENHLRALRSHLRPIN
ncbi:hypothetical protein [Kordiimonas sp. SCSIO 12610]|uniref:hypothetical protein n=1 Tax=Kordiimonas sp. SCSIO 12610 TaxID=2829597 RepID=UPI00210CA73C|nr:hypothetical protein [Kordiimonas sp. SCSIO 12610]UTW53799.1 hypothetical protein KFF44_08050 [Kordiimonas sp. SCSIO 12610]